MVGGSGGAQRRQRRHRAQGLRRRRRAEGRHAGAARPLHRARTQGGQAPHAGLPFARAGLERHGPATGRVSPALPGAPGREPAKPSPSTRTRARQGAGGRGHRGRHGPRARRRGADRRRRHRGGGARDLPRRPRPAGAAGAADPAAARRRRRDLLDLARRLDDSGLRPARRLGSGRAGPHAGRDLALPARRRQRHGRPRAHHLRALGTARRSHLAGRRHRRPRRDERPPARAHDLRRRPLVAGLGGRRRPAARRDASTSLCRKRRSRTSTATSSPAPVSFGFATSP